MSSNDQAQRGMQRLLPAWERGHARAAARVRLASGSVLVGLGVTTLVLGGRDRKTYSWAAVFLALAAAQLALAAWLRSIARGAPS